MKLKKIEWEDNPLTDEAFDCSYGTIGDIPVAYIREDSLVEWQWSVLDLVNYSGVEITLAKAKRAAESALTDFFNSLIEKE